MDCLQAVDAVLYESFLPIHLEDMKTALRQRVGRYVLKFFQELGGVVLAFSNVRVADRDSHKAPSQFRLHGECPTITVKLHVRFHVFIPSPGQLLTAKVTQISRDGLAGVVLNVFPVFFSTRTNGGGLPEWFEYHGPSIAEHQSVVGNSAVRGDKPGDKAAVKSSDSDTDSDGDSDSDSKASEPLQSWIDRTRQHTNPEDGIRVESWVRFRFVRWALASSRALVGIKGTMIPKNTLRCDAPAAENKFYRLDHVQDGASKEDMYWRTWQQLHAGFGLGLINKSTSAPTYNASAGEALTALAVSKVSTGVHEAITGSKRERTDGGDQAEQPSTATQVKRRKISLQL